MRTASLYDPRMNTSNMNAVLDLLRPDEISGCWRLVDLLVRGGSMSEEEALEWRRRIEARMRFLEIGTDSSPVH